ACWPTLCMPCTSPTSSWHWRLPSCRSQRSWRFPICDGLSEESWSFSFWQWAGSGLSWGDDPDDRGPIADCAPKREPRLRDFRDHAQSGRRVWAIVGWSPTEDDPSAAPARVPAIVFPRGTFDEKIPE